MDADVVFDDSSEDEAEGEGEDDLTDDCNSSEDELDDTAELVASLIGNASDPDGYMILIELPPLETEQDLQDMIGKPIMCGFETNKVMGW